MALTKAQLIDLNGNELILDLDADTSITADTDDQIDIKIGGADDFRFTANTFTALSGSTIAAQALTATTLTTTGAIAIANDGNIGSAGDADAIAISSSGVVTFSQSPVFPDGSLAVVDLDIDGATDIGANLADADLFVVDDGAGGTNRKMAASRIATYVGASAGAFSIANLDIDGGTDIGAALVDADEIIVDDGGGGTNRRSDMSRVKTYIADVTLTTAAQTNITSLGTLTTLTVDDVAIDGKVVTMTGSTDDTFVTTVGTNGATSLVTTDTAAAAANLTITADGTVGINSTGDMTLDSSTDIIFDADGGDFSFKDGGTEILKISNSSSDVIIKPIVDTKDIIFQQRDGTEVARIEDNATFNVVTGKLAINGTAITSTAAELNLLDGVSGLVQADLTKLAAVDSTATELNIVDGGTSATSTTIADADRVVLNDNGTMVQVAVTDLAAYFDDEITAMPNLVTTGALGSGSIATGFGAIDNGTSNITTGGLISLDVDADANDNTADSSSGMIQIGASGDLTLYHNTNSYIVNKTGNLVLHSETDDSDIVFTGEDGSSGITALTLDMSDAGTAVFNHDIRIADGGQIGSASDADAMTIASGGAVTFTQAPVFPDGSIAVADLDIDGATDIGADIVDADLFIIDDGAGGTNRKTAASRLKTYVGGGDTVLLATGGFPDSGDTINFSNAFDNSTYGMFIFYFADVYANGSNKITLQFETGGNGTYLTGTDYQRVNHGYDAAGDASKTSGSSEDRITIQTTNANQSNWASRSGYIIFNKPGQSSARKTVHGQISYFSTDSNSPLTIEQFAGMHSDGSNAVTGFRILASTSTFEGGNYYLYGLKSS